MKTCYACHVAKPLAEFPKNKRRKDGHGSKCLACQRAYLKDHYANNPTYYKRKAKRYTKEIREFILNAKRVPCNDCGNTYPTYVMDFDHVRGEKRFTLALAHRGAGLQGVKEEIAKCDVVCANCHRIRTHKRS